MQHMHSRTSRRDVRECMFHMLCADVAAVSKNQERKERLTRGAGPVKQKKHVPMKLGGPQRAKSHSGKRRVDKAMFCSFLISDFTMPKPDSENIPSTCGVSEGKI